MAAYLFDCVIVFITFLMLESLLAVLFLPANTTTVDERTHILFGLAGGAFQMAYFAIGWAGFRGSLGQRLLHLEMVDVTSSKAISCSLLRRAFDWAKCSLPKF